MNYYKDKVVLITGASSGIGKELAIQLAQQKAKLILIARRIEVLEDVQIECLHHTEFCEIIPFDLFDTAQILELASRIIGVYGQLDVLINNAGISQRSLVTETDISVDRSIMELDYFATVSLTKALLPALLKQSVTHIVVISSVSGLIGFPMRSAYAAAKHALHGFFETLQTEFLERPLHVTIVCPGRINTPISMSALTGNGLPHSKMDEGQKNGIPAAVCASQILTATQKKKKRIVIAKEEKILLMIRRWIPSLFFRIAHKKGME